MIVLGNGNVFPLLTAVLSIILFAVILWTLISYKYSRKREPSLKVLSVLCVITSAFALLLFNHISISGILICILLLTAAALQFLYFHTLEK